MTAFVSASCKRSASAGGLHSSAKSVHFASLSFLGLISSFHFYSPFGTLAAFSSAHAAEAHLAGGASRGVFTLRDSGKHSYP